ncbi:BZ3501_MvSof-1269-A2-R1_Chr12-3g03608 [Microbotryum saponariae]|nr:BZ3501_MvSof-1269-A2-R1_Chr12-3g03608 [Microbotryum saponariae]
MGYLLEGANNSRQLWSRFPPSPRRLAPPQLRGFQTLTRTVPATPKWIWQAIHTTESKKTAQMRNYLTTLSPHHSWLGKTRRFGPHNELSLRPLVPRKQKSEWKFVSRLPVLELPRFIATEKHRWAPRKYECCLAVVERPYGNAPSQPAKVDLLWRFYEWPSLLGGPQKRSGKGWQTWERETTGPRENMLYSTRVPFIRALVRQEVFRQANTATLAFESECVLRVCTGKFLISRLTISSLAIPSFPPVVATRDIEHLPKKLHRKDSHIQRSTLTKLESMLGTGTRFVREFASAKARAGWGTAKEWVLRLCLPPGRDRRTHNLPTSSTEMGMLICDSDTNTGDHGLQDLILQVLGEDGFHPNISLCGFHQAGLPIARNREQIDNGVQSREVLAGLGLDDEGEEEDEDRDDR